MVLEEALNTFCIDACFCAWADPLRCTEVRKDRASSAEERNQIFNRPVLKASWYILSTTNQEGQQAFRTGSRTPSYPILAAPSTLHVLWPTVGGSLFGASIRRREQSKDRAVRDSMR